MGAGELVFFGAPTSTDAKDSDLSPNPHSGGDAYTIVVQKGTHLPQQICLLGHTVHLLYFVEAAGSLQKSFQKHFVVNRP
jgi:hypothetical protein